MKSGMAIRAISAAMLAAAAAPPHRILFSRLGPVRTGLFIASSDGSGERALGGRDTRLGA